MPSRGRSPHIVYYRVKARENRTAHHADAWEQRAVGEFYFFKNGLNKEKEYFGHGTPIVNFTDVFNNRSLYTHDLRGKVMLEEKEIANYEVKKGDLFFTRTSETINEIGYPSVMLDEPKQTVFSGFVLRGRAIEDDPLADIFKSYVFFTKEFREEMVKKSSMTTRALTSGTAIKEMLFNFPLLKSEQTAIGEFFRTLDAAITLHQRKLDGLRELKKGYLQQMFPQAGERVPRVRFAGFCGDWQEQRLGELTDFYSGLTYSPENVIESGGTFVLRSSNVKDGEIIDADNVYVDSDVVNCRNVEKDDVIVVVRNGSRSLIGKHAQIKADMAHTVIGAFMTGLRSERPALINALLDTTQFEIEITKNLGATINQITTGAFKQMLFAIPPETSEQTAIGNFFFIIDNQITALSMKIERLIDLKAAYLQRMFV